MKIRVLNNLTYAQAVDKYNDQEKEKATKPLPPTATQGTHNRSERHNQNLNLVNDPPPTTF